MRLIRFTLVLFFIASAAVPAFAQVSQPLDFGDAPDQLGTTLFSNGPRHRIIPGFSLGASVDAESNGQPSVNADGDGSDEDGVTFPNGGVLQPCSTVTVFVYLTNTANVATPKLDAWIDFRKRPGQSFIDRVANRLPLAAGRNSVVFAVPCDAGSGQTYMRFRLSSTGVNIATGDGSGQEGSNGKTVDGEVEDYALTIAAGYDFGDAPDSYGTTLAADGARHLIYPGFFLNQAPDQEADGQPSVGATGDGADENGGGDLGAITTCSASYMGISVTNTAGRPASKVDAWIDFDGDGHFDSPRDRVATGVSITPGLADGFAYSVPCDARPGLTYARIRLSSAGVTSPTGPAADGEVEDYAITIEGQQLDFGDAPDSYGTSIATNGARHVLRSGFSLGATIDAESDGQPSLSASGDGSDEDGVALPALIETCSENRVQIQLTDMVGVSAPKFDGWIDFDGDGHFDSPRDRVATGMSLTPGLPNSLTFTVPCDARPGLTYARFRLSSAGVTSPNGPATDGEVEDYAVTIQRQQLDFGDAPDSYGTTLAANGARHPIVPGFFLNQPPDAEADGQPSVGATGDGADENGDAGWDLITTCSAVTEGVSVTNTAGLPAAKLDAWIDFDGDGHFDSPRDRVATGMSLTPGLPNSLTFTVPCDARPGLSYARLRLSSAGVASPTGSAADGEVEDYAVTIKAQQLDFGDAPDSYGTSVAANGARHGLRSGFSLGATIDVESDGQPSLSASGDGSDEDGVALPALIGTCVENRVQIQLTNTAGVPAPKLDAWIDFDADGHFDDPRDRIASALMLTPGVNTLTFTAPCNSSSQRTYARFRLSSTGVASAIGTAVDGEVEDYPVSIGAFDFGDAPQPAFATLLTANGARHRVLPANNPTLGASVDTEIDGRPTADAKGDDNAVLDDEDGVTFPAPLVPGTTGDITLRTGTTGGFVSCWMNVNPNGATERIVRDLAMPANATRTMNFTVPIGVTDGLTFARCRISTVAGLTPVGEAADGEVEDHVVPISLERASIASGACVPGIAPDGQRSGWSDVAYDVRLQNTGAVLLTSISAITPLASVFSTPASYEIISLKGEGVPVNSAYDGRTDSNMLGGGATLAPGNSAVIHLLLRATTNGAPRTFALSTHVSGVTPAGVAVSADSQDGCVADPDGNLYDNGTVTSITIPSVSRRRRSSGR